MSDAVTLPNGTVVPVQGQPSTPPAQPVQQPAPAVQVPVAPAQPAPVAPPEAYNPSTGDAVIDLSVQNFTRAYSVSGDVFKSAVQPALDAGDVSKLDYAALVKAGGADAAAQAIALVNALSGHVKGKATSAADAVHAVAGSKENWAAAVTLFNQAQPDFVKEQFSELLNSGDSAKVDYAAKQIVQLAKQAGVVASGLPLQPGAGAPGQVQALSRAEFNEKLNDLYKRAGNRSLDNGPFGQEYQTLLAARDAGRKLNK